MSGMHHGMMVAWACVKRVKMMSVCMFHQSVLYICWCFLLFVVFVLCTDNVDIMSLLVSFLLFHHVF